MAVTEQTLRRKSLLVVDDQDAHRQVLKGVLEDSGYTILDASTAERGLELVRDNPDISCVVADVYFPHAAMNGLGLVEKIREERMGVPVILTSSIPTVELLKRALNKERDVVIGFIPKGDLDIAQLSEEVSGIVKIYEENKKTQATDLKSGVLNWRYFTRELKAEVSRAYRSGEPLSLAFADIDRFKTINDEKGHDVGDAVLRAIGDYLKEKLREYDVIGRNSDAADEFAIALPEATAQDARRIISRIAAPEEINPYVRSRIKRDIDPVTLSCGIAIYQRTKEKMYIPKPGELERDTQMLIKKSMTRQEEAKIISHAERTSRYYRTIILLDEKTN